MTRLVDDLLDVVAHHAAARSSCASERVDLRDGRRAARVETAPAAASTRAAHSSTRRRCRRQPLVRRRRPDAPGAGVRNLLNNAAKYTDRGRRASASRVERDDGDVRDPVRDNGIGIAAGAAAAHLRPVRAGRRSRSTARRAGSGIGLTLVQRLVELHGGTVEARSDGPGRGQRVRRRACRASARRAPTRRRGRRSRRPPAHGAARPGRRRQPRRRRGRRAVLLAARRPRGQGGRRRRRGAGARAPVFAPDVVAARHRPAGTGRLRGRAPRCARCRRRATRC